MQNQINVEQIKKLWILDLVVQARSLKKAAAQANVTPSAISQTISSLEASYGKALLIRNRNFISATEEAKSLLATVRPAFEIFERLRNLNEPAAPKIAWLNFGTYESIAIDILPGLITSLRTKLPKARLGLVTARTHQLLAMVRKGELCSALVAEVDDLSRFYAKTVFEDRLGLYVSRRHPISELGWGAIAKFGVASLAPAKDGHPRYFTKYLRQFPDWKPFLLSESFETLRASAAAGVTVSVLPQAVALRSNDLLEITPPKLLKEQGAHKLLVVSSLKCDREETDFLAEQASVLLQRRQ